MKKQMAYSTASTLGPFWTLMLLIASGKTLQAEPPLPCGRSDEATGCSACVPLDETRDFQACSGTARELKRTSQAYTFPTPTTLGPFLTLILTLHKERRESDAGNYTASARRVMVTG